MSNLGSYQDLTMNAYDAGGPEAYLDGIREEGVREGRIEAGVIGAAGALISALVAGVASWKLKEKHEQARKKGAKLKEEVLEESGVGPASVEVSEPQGCCDAVNGRACGEFSEADGAMPEDSEEGFRGNGN